MAEASQQGEARRIAVTLADALGFDELGRSEVAIVVTEAATNLVKHARQGELLLRPVHVGDAHGLEVLALDRGPGLHDVPRAIGDGYSTAGSSGTGLGAIRRMASAFDVHSLPGAGTTLVATLWADGREGSPTGRQTRAIARAEAGECALGVVCVPYPGEHECGDAWAVRATPEGATAMVVDGLGHGPIAAQAARAVVESFHEGDDDAPGAIIARAHEAARSTRGAALSVARLDLRAGRVTYAGIGNVAGSVIDGVGVQHMVSHNGTVGHQMRRVHELSYQWPRGAALVLHSDGLSTSWRIDRYPGLVQRHPALIAATLYRDASRGRDDATVLVLREQTGSLA